MANQDQQVPVLTEDDWEMNDSGDGIRIKPAWVAQLTDEQRARIRCVFGEGRDDERIGDCVRRLASPAAS